jgi:hypothetical protein
MILVGPFQPRLPEIDSGRTLIARSSTGSVGPGERRFRRAVLELRVLPRWG